MRKPDHSSRHKGCSVAVNGYDRVSRAQQKRRSSFCCGLRGFRSDLTKQVIECLSTPVGDQPLRGHDSGLKSSDQALSGLKRSEPRVIGRYSHNTTAPCSAILLTIGARPASLIVDFASGTSSLRTTVKSDSPIIIILDLIRLRCILEMVSRNRGEKSPRQSANLRDNLMKVSVSGPLTWRETRPFAHRLIRFFKPVLDRTPAVDIGPKAPETILIDDEGMILLNCANPGAPGRVRITNPP